MKRIILTVAVFAVVSLVACTAPPTSLTQATDDQTAAPTVPTTAPAQTSPSDADEEAAIKTLVENFGMRLQQVSLQAPDAAQEIQQQYSDFVSPALLESWIKDTSKAPGRLVSSPWPDRIEITTLSQANPDRYEMTGFVIEVTSTEVGKGGAAAKIPIRIVVQREQGSWLITEYAEEQ